MAVKEITEEIVEEVATNLEDVADATRKLNTVGLSYLAVGLGIGAAVGFYIGYKFNRAKIFAEVYADAREEIDQMREVYLDKTAIVTTDTEKPTLEKVIEERGYSMHTTLESPPRPLPAPVPVSEAHVRVTIEQESLPDIPASRIKSMNEGWNYEEELKNRTPEAAYVIHQNEYNHSNQEYSKVVYTYYAIDDVVTDSEDERPIINGDIVVGLDNLKFGHGSDDADVVYVRNDVLELDMQICRVHRSFEEEVLGISRDDDDN